MFNSEKLNFIAFICIFISIVLFAGKPDLMDAFVNKMSDGQLKCTSVTDGRPYIFQLN